MVGRGLDRPPLSSGGEEDRGRPGSADRPLPGKRAIQPGSRGLFATLRIGELAARIQRERGRFGP